MFIHDHDTTQFLFLFFFPRYQRFTKDEKIVFALFCSFLHISSSHFMAILLFITLQ